jgi:hypothetical protein
VLATMKLHNFCLDKGVAVPRRQFYEDVREGDQWAVYDNAQDDDMFLYDRALGEH